MSLSRNVVLQASAVPINDGKICLISSSDGDRWVIPKGTIEPGMTAGQTALQEAWEEAGLVGWLQPNPAGAYLYEKWFGTCHITVYLMEVTEIHDDWPERGLRDRRWLPPAQALAKLTVSELREIILAAIVGRT